MITTPMLYWMTRLDGLRHALEVVEVLMVVMPILLSVALAIWYVGSEMPAKAVRAICITLAAGAVSVVFLEFGRALVPTTREMAALLVIPRIANSETVQEIGAEAKSLAMEWLQELRPASKTGRNDEAEEK